MSGFRLIDMTLLDEIFDMGSGYVLNFSDRTFAHFFAELDIDINAALYSRNGSSKAKRLRCFLQTVDTIVAVRTLKALWEYREAIRGNQEEKVHNACGRLLSLINRLEGKAETPTSKVSPPVPAFNRPLLLELKSELLALNNLAAQARGYAFEKFLKRLFNAFGLSAQEPFRLRGEQIDGSFQYASETYLVEAKWKGEPTGVADLHVFHGKIEQKAAWTRGLFVSESGFTPDGLIAFGKAKRVICMDGLDLYDMLDREIPLTNVLERKLRHAAETGNPFARVRDLFSL
ncbi:restriction endonuclease [Undibacterium sp. RuTC16W]|uniref:restriction endonuclease n=1 Tax=Undibacterium sp. RuTC16W TaxID=3413048 RepID=UPI003BF1E961